MSNPVTIVTGAGSGIGAACAQLLARRGHAVVLVGRRAERLERVRATMVEPTRHRVIAADVRLRDPSQSVVDRTVDEFGRLDALILAAGCAPRAMIDATDDAMLDECFRTNTLGPAHMVTRAWPQFKRQQSGRIVFISTLGAMDPFPGFFAYAASKSAVDSFARSVKAEGESLGIHAFAINPGCVETAMLRQNFSTSVVPPERTISPEAVAEVVVACACGERDRESGSSIAVPSP